MVAFTLRCQRLTPNGGPPPDGRDELKILVLDSTRYHPHGRVAGLQRFDATTLLGSEMLRAMNTQTLLTRRDRPSFNFEGMILIPVRANRLAFAGKREDDH